MSSPVAHTSLFLLFWPRLRAKIQSTASRPRRLLFATALLATLMGPDFDLVGWFFTDAPISTYHNGPTNSLFMITIGGVAFAIIARCIIRLPWPTLFAVGCTAYASHILVDFMTSGRGLQLFWPLSSARFQSPFILLRGVEHTGSVTLGTHALNLLSDILFAIAVWIASGWFKPRVAPPTSRN